MTEKETLEKWANSLTINQLIKVVIDLTGYAIDSEEVRISDEGEPYYRNTGDILTFGEKT